MVRMLAILILLATRSVFGVSATLVRIIDDDPSTRAMLVQHVRTLQLNDVPSHDLADSLRNWLVGQGYLEAEVAVGNDTLVATPGTLFLLDCVSPSNDMTASCNLARPFTLENVASVIDEQLEQYRAQGFYYAQGSVVSVEVNRPKVTVRSNVTPGPLVTVSAVEYDGLARSRASLIDQYVAVRPGDTITDDFLRRAENRAARVPFVGFETPVTIRPRPGYSQADLVLRFHERPQVTFFGGMAYQPDENRRALFNLDLTLRNLFGDGRLVALLADHRDANRNTLNLSYGQPLFLTGVGWLTARIHTRDYRDQFYEFGSMVGYTSQTGEALSLGLNLAFKRVEPALGPNRYRRYSAELALERDGLDDPQNPSHGLDLESSISFAFRRYINDSAVIEGGRSFNETHAVFRAEFVQPLWGHLVGHAVLGYRGFETSERLPPVSELLLIGGPGTLRGFRTEQFTAQRTALGTLEPRYRFAQGHIFTFIDLAYLNRPTTDGTEELFRYGYGIGFGARDNARAVRFSLGWNPDIRIDQPRLSVELATDL